MGLVQRLIDKVSRVDRLRCRQKPFTTKSKLGEGCQKPFLRVPRPQIIQSCSCFYHYWFWSFVPSQPGPCACCSGSGLRLSRYGGAGAWLCLVRSGAT